MEKTNMKNLYFILITLCFFGGMFLSANAADMSIDMLNKKGKEKMLYSVSQKIKVITYSLSLDLMDGNFQRSLR